MKAKSSAKPREKKTPETIQAEAIRARCNKLTKDEREKLLNRAMQIAYGEARHAAADRAFSRAKIDRNTPSLEKLS